MSNPLRLGENDAPSLLAIFLWLVGWLVACLSFVLVFRGSAGDFPWAGAFLHLVATALAGLGTAHAKGLTHPAARGWAVLVIFFAFFGGPLGYLAGVACYLFGVGQPTEMPLVEVVKAEMWIKPLPDREELVTFEAQLREELRTQPIVDLIPYADVPTAIAIINKLAETKTYEDVQLLRRMTTDRRPEVYQYALSKLDTMEREYALRIFRLQDQLSARADAGPLRIELAKLYLEYTESGLMEGALLDYYWELTLGQVLEAMLLEPTRRDLLLDLARLFSARRRYPEAQRILEDIVGRERGNLKAQLLLMECLMERAQSENKPELLLQARRRALESAWALRLPPASHPLHALARFWFGREKAASHA